MGSCAVVNREINNTLVWSECVLIGDLDQQPQQQLVEQPTDGGAGGGAASN